MLFQGPSILKFSCAYGANNQPHQFGRPNTRFIIATSETILNIVKNFVRKYSKLFGNFSTAPPHSSDVRYGPACGRLIGALDKVRASTNTYSVVGRQPSR